ncbi:MAG: hypothetical protein [Arizlama microvirus]|nr:MAG: hypothetical protein [Arizlama microvirus]
MKRNRLGFFDRLEVRARNEDMLRLTVGWRDAPSIVQLEPKNPNVVSPEIRAMMDAMNRNAVRREMALRAEFERKLGQAQAPAA